MVGLFSSRGPLVPNVLHTILGEDKWQSRFSGQRVKKENTFARPLVAYQVYSSVSSSSNGCTISRTTTANGCDLVQSQLLTTTLQCSSEQDKQDCCKVHTFWTQSNVFWENQLIFRFYCQPLSWFDTAFDKLLCPSVTVTGSTQAHVGRSYTAHSKDPEPSCPVCPSTAVRRVNPNDSRGIRVRWGVRISSIQTKAFPH